MAILARQVASQAHLECLLVPGDLGVERDELENFQKKGQSRRNSPQRPGDSKSKRQGESYTVPEHPALPGIPWPSSPSDEEL